MGDTREGPEAVERQALDDRLALIGVLQELTVGALDLFDPSRNLDDFLQTVAARLGCRVALCLGITNEHQLVLRGSAGLARTSLGLALPVAAEPYDELALTLPFPEIAPTHLTRWLVCPGDDGPGSPPAHWWLVLYFDREPRQARQYQRMMERFARHLDAAFEHRRLNEDLERRVAERTRELAAANQELTRSLEALRQTQERLLQSEKMAAIGQLASGVAHEINNPLGVILGFAQGIDRRTPEGDALKLPASSIVREALRCKRLVQELLTFSRVGRKTIEPLDLGEVLRSTVPLILARARTQNVSIESAIAPAPMLGNSTQLQQIIVNLGTNALDAMKGGGQLQLSCGVNDGQVRLVATDSGCGIPEEIRARVFEPFFTTKGVGEGTGLGLSLLYEIVTQHKGHVEFQSQIGVGTRFVITFPLAQGQPLAA